jgi:hypothetical protein
VATFRRRIEGPVLTFPYAPLPPFVQLFRKVTGAGE